MGSANFVSVPNAGSRSIGESLKVCLMEEKTIIKGLATLKLDIAL
jgi:hypothetical protein